MTPVVEVLIGLFFVYMILSVIVSAINEGLAGLFGWRSSYFVKGVKSLLGSTLTGQFFEQDLIKSLSNSRARLRWNRTPSYVSASTFTETVLDLMRTIQPPSQPDPSEPIASESDPLVPTTEDRVLQEWRKDLGATSGSETEPSNQQIAELDAPISSVLRIYADAATDLDDFKKKIDGWFEEAMDRVGGWYKRFTRLIMFTIGIILVLALNADSVNIANSLWREAPLRSAVVEQAGSVAGGEQPDANQAATELNDLEQLNLPLGWVTGSNRASDPRRWPGTWTEYLIKVFGLLITAIALSFGATFWFDLLKKFVGIRSSGAEPQPAQTGPPSGAAEKPQRLEISAVPNSFPEGPGQA